MIHYWRYHWQRKEVRFLHSSEPAGVPEPRMAVISSFYSPQVCDCLHPAFRGGVQNLKPDHFWLERIRDYDGTGFPDIWLVHQHCLTCGTSHEVHRHEGGFAAVQKKILTGEI